VTEQQQDLDQLSAVLGAALGDATRLRIIMLLARRGELNSGELQRLVDKKWSNVSQHLQYLRRFDVIDSRRESQFVYYRLAMPGIGRLATAVVRDAKKLLSTEGED